MKVSISARIYKNFCLRHNSRDIVAKNVVTEKTKNNITWVEPGMTCGDSNYSTIKQIYDKVFEPSWRAFQERQVPIRKTDKSYYQTILDKHFEAQSSGNAQIKDENVAVEFIFQVGNIDTCNVNTENGNKAKVLLEDFYKDFINRDYVCTVTEKELKDSKWKPPFEFGVIIVSAHLHSDEIGTGSGGTNHIHIVAIPFGESSRGAEYNSQLGNCFKGLGYPTIFESKLDKFGNPIQKPDKNNNPAFDKTGNPVYKITPVKMGVIDWLEDQKQIIEKDMKEKYGWERDKQTDGRKTYLQVADYKVFKAKEKEKELNETINNLEFDSTSAILSVLENKEEITEKIAEELSDSAFSKLSSDDTRLIISYISQLSDDERERMLNDIRFSKKSESILEETKDTIEQRLLSTVVKDLKDKTYDKNIKQLWSDYRDSSEQFWNWYNCEKDSIERKKRNKQAELNKNQVLYTSSYKMLYYSNNLIVNLLGLLLELFLKYRKQVILEQLKELTTARKELSKISKSTSAKFYKEREDIKEITAQKYLLNSIKKTESTLKHNQEKIIKAKQREL